MAKDTGCHHSVLSKDNCRQRIFDHNNLFQVVAPGSIAEEVEEEKTSVEQPEISYSDTVKNRANGEMTGMDGLEIITTVGLCTFCT